MPNTKNVFSARMLSWFVLDRKNVYLVCERLTAVSSAHPERCALVVVVELVDKLAFQEVYHHYWNRLLVTLLHREK